MYAYEQLHTQEYLMGNGEVEGNFLALCGRGHLKQIFPFCKNPDKTWSTTAVGPPSDMSMHFPSLQSTLGVNQWL